MRRIRVIPVLLLQENGLVKTVRFRRPKYLGDPINAVKIFNEKKIDELVVLDIDAAKNECMDYDRIEDIVSEAFMPVAYGGGIRSIEQCGELLRRGVEKIILNTSAHLKPELIKAAAAQFGSQSIVVSIDAKTDLFGRTRAWIQGGTKNTGLCPVELARQSVSRGAGEIMLTSIAKEGTFSGYDIPLFHSVSSAVDVPVIGHGGAGNLDDFRQAVQDGGCSAVAAASMFVYARQGEGVLINYTDQEALIAHFWNLLT